jgi:branched-chain amino acid transport system permease protein
MSGRPAAGGLAALGALPAGLALLFAAGFLLPLTGSDYLIGVALTFFMWVALVESWIVLSGLTGYLSLGHAVFYGLGAYVMVLTWQGVPMPLGVLLGGLASAALALAVGFPCLRVRGPYFVMLTFGLSEFVKFLVVNVEAGLGKAGRLIFGGPSIAALYWWIVALALAATLLAFVVSRSRLGAGLRAIREDEIAAETTGVPVTRLKLLAFVLSAVVPGMVGAVMMLRSTYFEPIQAFNPITSFTIVTMAILGGSDDVPGPILGAAFLILLSELLLTTAPEAYMIVLGLLLVVFVLGAPDGIQGRLAALRARRR